MSITESVLFENYPELRPLSAVMERAAILLEETFRSGKKLLLCGNGGSAADCEHIAGELLKGFMQKRPLGRPDPKAVYPFPEGTDGEYILSVLQKGLPAIPLPSLLAARSAYANDVDPKLDYAQLTYSLGVRGDVLMALSTSGNSENVCAAAAVAKAVGMQVIALTGSDGGRLKQLADVLIAVPAAETYRVQEYHLPVYHYLCARIEDDLF